MRRNECTVEALKELGYSAKVNFCGIWRYGNDEEKDCNEKQAIELFEAIVNIVKNGGAVEIRRNNFRYTVNVFVDEARHTYRGTETVYYLSRPMTEAERLEADLYTGRNK